jgi:hypothetical protein
MTKTRQRWVLQGITTRYVGPSNTRGSRIVARAASGSASLPYDHDLNTEDMHHAAAMKLAAKLRWLDECDFDVWVQGGSPDGNGFIFVRLLEELK